MPLPPLLLERLKRKKGLSNLDFVSTDPGLNQSTPPEVCKKKNSSRAEYSYQDTSGPSVVNSDLIVSDSGSGEGNANAELEEEIIAEDYSEDENGAEAGLEIVAKNDQDSYTRTNDCDKRLNVKTREELDNGGKHDNSLAQPVSSNRTESVIGCPNKYNIYHECNQYCDDNYSRPEALEPTLEQRKQLAMILRTYPMTNEWTVVYDPGVRTFYFWNIITNLVSWFPPAMNGFVSLPADQIRKSMRGMDFI